MLRLTLQFFFWGGGAWFCSYEYCNWDSKTK